MWGPHEYIIPSNDFCSVYHWIHDTPPVYPSCDLNTPPKIIFYDGIHESCTVDMAKPKDDSDNKYCVKDTWPKKYTNYGTNEKSTWLVYVVHGYKGGEHLDWPKDLKDSIIERYSSGKRRVVVGIVYWEYGAQSESHNYTSSLEG